MPTKYFESDEEKRNRLEREKQERLDEENRSIAARLPKVEEFVKAKDAQVRDIYEDWLRARGSSELDVMSHSSGWSTLRRDRDSPRKSGEFVNPVARIEAPLVEADEPTRLVVVSKHIGDYPSNEVQELASVLEKETGASVSIKKLPWPKRPMPEL